MTDVVLGIDAGGTSVRAALQEIHGETPTPWGTARVGADSEGGPEILPSLLETLWAQTGITPDQVSGVCAGITKITRAGVQERWEAGLRAALPRVQTVRIVPDYVIAFHGALPTGTGIAVIAGTGSVVYGENAMGQTLRVGGRGWEYGDEGSGTWLTTEAIRRTLRARDGLAPDTALTRALCAELGTEEPARLGEAARQRAATGGRGFLVPLILQHARDGDAEARELFVGAAGWLAAQVRATAQRLDYKPKDAFSVAVIGGLWEAGELLQIPFQQVLQRWLPASSVISPIDPPVAGALRLAALSNGLH